MSFWLDLPEGEGVSERETKSRQIHHHSDYLGGELPSALLLSLSPLAARLLSRSCRSVLCPPTERQADQVSRGNRPRCRSIRGERQRGSGATQTEGRTRRAEAGSKASREARGKILPTGLDFRQKDGKPRDAPHGCTRTAVPTRRLLQVPPRLEGLLRPL